MSYRYKRFTTSLLLRDLRFGKGRPQAGGVKQEVTTYERDYVAAQLQALMPTND